MRFRSWAKKTRGPYILTALFSWRRSEYNQSRAALSLTSARRAGSVGSPRQPSKLPAGKRRAHTTYTGPSSHLIAPRATTYARSSLSKTGLFADIINYVREDFCGLPGVRAKVGLGVPAAVDQRLQLPGPSRVQRWSHPELEHLFFRCRWVGCVNVAVRIKCVR